MRKYFSFLISAATFIFLYLPLLPRLVQHWMKDRDFSHGFFIPILSLYFIWRNRNDLKKTEITPDNKGLLLVILGALFYFFSKVAHIFSFESYSMIIVLLGLVYLHAGKEMLKKLVFPVCYLIFMMPQPGIVYSNVNFYLRTLSTKASFAIIKMTGINVTREGNIINFPTYQLLIGTPCSGIVTLMTFAAASLAIGYVLQKSILKRAILFASSIIIAFAMNVIRIVATGVISHLFKVSSVPSSVHDWTGYIVLIIGVALLFKLNNILKTNDRSI